jgi:hypothetical protein
MIAYDTIQTMIQRKMLASMPANVRAEYEAANRRLSQSIKAAEEPETVRYTQANAATVLAAAIANYKGITPTTDTKQTKRKVGSGDGPVTEFEKTTNFLGDAIKAAREAKLLAGARDNKGTDAEKPEAAKSLAQLLVEAQDEL